MAHPFSSLSPDLVMSAIESVGIWPAGEPFALNSYENRVLMFRDEEGERWVVKFYRPGRWADAAIQEEHDFLKELALAGVPVIAPWCSADGVSWHHFQTFRFALFPQCVGQAQNSITRHTCLRWEMSWGACMMLPLASGFSIGRVCRSRMALPMLRSESWQALIWTSTSPGHTRPWWKS